MIDYIVKSANCLIEKYNTRNPFEIAKLLGIYVNCLPLGNLKGFYKVVNRERHIVLNDSLEDWEQNIVLAHELGHDRLHRSIAAISAMSDYSLLLPLGKTEREANLFASEILLPDDTLLEHFDCEDLSLEQLSGQLEIPIAFLQYKLYILCRKYPLLGMSIPEIISDSLRER